MFPQPGTVCKISGFGSTKDSVPGTFVFNIQMSDVMNVAVVPILEQSGCATRMATQISRNMFCAGYFEGGKDACQVRSEFLIKKRRAVRTPESARSVGCAYKY